MSLATRVNTSMVWPQVVWFSFLLLAGCDSPPNQFFVVHNQAPTAGCLITADRSAPYIGEGVLDVRLVDSSAVNAYLLFPLLQNSLPPAGDGQIEPNRIALRGFDVDILEPIDAPQGIRDLFFDNPMLHFREPWSGSVEPGGGLTASSVNIIPAQLARDIRATQELPGVSHLQLRVQVRARGERSTGQVESDPFLYPIKICDGCLIARNEPCPFSSATTRTGNACNTAQDSSVDCCTIGDSLICPPVVAQ
jgi:hypothetical protein